MTEPTKCDCGGKLTRHSNGYGDWPIYIVWYTCQACGERTGRHYEIDGSDEWFSDVDAAKAAL